MFYSTIVASYTFVRSLLSLICRGEQCSPAKESAHPFGRPMVAPTIAHRRRSATCSVKNPGRLTRCSLRNSLGFFLNPPSLFRPPDALGNLLGQKYGRTTHIRSYYSLFLPQVAFTSSATGGVRQLDNLVEKWYYKVSYLNFKRREL